jgi:hypothetical protein
MFIKLFHIFNQHLWSKTFFSMIQHKKNIYIFMTGQMNSNVDHFLEFYNSSFPRESESKNKSFLQNLQLCYYQVTIQIFSVKLQ